MQISTSVLLQLVALLLVSSTNAAELKSQFEAQKHWNSFGKIKSAGSKISVVKQGDSLISNISSNGKQRRAKFLVSKGKHSDVQMKMEFMIPKRSNSGAYFMGRYEIQILDSFNKPKAGFGDLGGLSQRWDKQRNPAGFGGVAPLLNAAKAAGEWQSMEVIFRAPRFAADGTKLHHAKFIKVLINGKLVQENVQAKGPTRFSKFNDESAGPESLYIQGDHGPIAIRKFELTKLELSTDGETPLTGKEAIPLDDQGQYMFNAVAHGKELFHSKGCVECHSTAAGEVKTGPSLHGLFTKKPKQIEVVEAAEGHRKMRQASKEYLSESLRNPHGELALKADNTSYLPIMPAFSYKALNDDDVDALYHYLLTLNPKSNAGPSFIWQKKYSPKYLLKKDAISIWVKNYPRLEHVNLGENISARAYHVGLPGDLNYSFDPRTMAITQVWDGPFMRKNDQVGRGNRANEKGFKHRVYTQLADLFHPYDSSGQLIDLSFASPARLFDPKQSEKFLADSSDFLARVENFPARFSGVETPKQMTPKFLYSVGANKVNLELNINKNLQLEAKFELELVTDQQFAIPKDGLLDIEVSHGEIRDGKWIIQKGKYPVVMFKATMVKLAGQLYSSEIEATESYAPQDLIWSKSSKKASLHSGYTIEDASLPKGPFGRALVFDPLGIEFYKDQVFVSTRTAGVWKIVNGQWHLFAEGTYESIGLVVNSECDIVIGEKTGLTRLIDSDGDHWSEKRINLSDQFRFNGDYHEYLHGPIKRNGKYLFSLNLGNQVRKMYKANGAYMGTVGGLRGWMLSTDENGSTEVFANGFRSPSGLALSPNNEIVYTENQGEYVGTSKLFKVKKGGFYGNPTGLVDIPGLNAASPEIAWDVVKDSRELPVVLFPHAKVMNGPGSPEFLTEKIKFGPFQGQMFVGDQALSNIHRVDTEMVSGREQGVVLPFADGLKSGAMRLKFDPNDSSLWIGQTGRGWKARGGSPFALQRINFDPKVAVNAMQTVRVTKNGFDLHFTQAQSDVDHFGSIACTSWYYSNSSAYGSEELGTRQEKILKATWSSAKTVCSVTLENFHVSQGDSSDSSRVYMIDLGQTNFAKSTDPFFAKAYYTLHSIPK